MSAAPVRALQSIRARGVRPTLRIAARESRRVAVARGRLAAERRFDRRLGVETAGIVRLDDLRREDGSWDDARMYEPTAVPVLDEILGSLPADPAGCTFVDLGSGKGRAVLHAAEAGYRRAIGVELSRSLHECAEQNVAAWRQRHPGRDVAVVCADATAYRLPADPLVLFLYDPFGEESVARVAAGLAGSLREHPREVHVAYVAPHYRAAFDAVPGLRPLAEGERWATWGP